MQVYAAFAGNNGPKAPLNLLGGKRAAGQRRIPMDLQIEPILIVVVIVLAFGGGGYWGRRRGHW